MRVALLSCNARAGDAIGNQLAEKLAFFLDHGADVRVFVESDELLHPALRPHGRVVAPAAPEGEAWRFLTAADLLVVEYGQHYALLDWLPLLAGGRPRILFDYHGVTPPQLWDAHNREALERGAGQRGLVWFADMAVVHSRFTGRELVQPTRYPAARLYHLSHPVDTQRFRPGPPTRPLRDELGLGHATLLLFVGRLAPNKRVPILVETLDRLREHTPPVHAILIGDTSDLYAAEVERCRDRAAALGVADRLHFLGRVADDRLPDAYRSADVFVMPSRHEGFCIPLLEAMACGVPVVAARAGALPETLGDAGLTFTPDDADDLARQLRRILPGSRPSLAPAPASDPLRVAVVCYRYGAACVGGAETSLRTMATVLAQAGHGVEVFTTCTLAENDWSDQLPEGTTREDGIPVHRYRLDDHDRTRHLESFRAILEAEAPPPDEREQEYLTHSIHSRRLLEALRQRIDAFDAVLVGPYLFGLTHDVARAVPEKTLLVPCFHDEPLARLRAWPAAYGEVGGIVYHSPEEQTFAQNELGLNHPRASCLGALIAADRAGDADRGRHLVGSDRPYLVYCGRYSAYKNLPLLLDYLRRYDEAHPGEFRLVTLGRGEVPIPTAPWVRDLGFVDETRKRDIVAGAAALVQLSCYESLSLAALEAWSQGVPVVAHRACAVLAGQLQRSGGGRTIADYESFAAALDDLRRQPEHWRDLGRQGRAYVRAYYGSAVAYREGLGQAIRALAVPLADRMRQAGLDRARSHARPAWRERFGRLIDEVLHAPAVPCRHCLEVRLRTEERTVAGGLTTALVPVRLHNAGTHPAVADGPGRTVVRCRVRDEAGQPVPGLEATTPLPGLLLPDQTMAAAVRMPVPAAPGAYQAEFHVEQLERAEKEDKAVALADACLRLEVVESPARREDQCCGPLLQTVQAALTEADRRQSLPDNYTDVTEGLLAEWKRRIKQKLLNNFKRAYVDVLSRQQSAFNRHVLTALQELAECCAMLDHAGRATPPPDQALVAAVEQALAAGRAEDLAVLLRGLLDELANSRRRLDRVEKELRRLKRRSDVRPR